MKFFSGIKVDNATSKLPTYVNKYLGEYTDGITSIQLAFQTLEDIYLKSDLTKEISINGNGKFVWFMLLIAALILIIAYVNYINLFESCFITWANAFKQGVKSKRLKATFDSKYLLKILNL
ncbi:MAG: hypothetical protein ACK5H1_06390 [Tenacibaculum sp.]